jgi:hypothetical protein
MNSEVVNTQQVVTELLQARAASGTEFGDVREAG